MHKKRQGDSSGTRMDFKDDRMEIKTIMKEIELLGSSCMTWKERKELENKKVVSLGGKPVKKQRLPLSVARVVMKKQKERDQKMLQENLILGRFGGKHSGGTQKVMDKRKPGDRVLKSSEGYFRNGVLDVKNLLQPASSKDNNTSAHVFEGKQKKGRGKKNQGKKKGGGRKRH